ncbi:MAG: preprotein translocase subunit SecG [Candidatus Harrisonbacteria bacterium]|nr:preprotein translocase subunit SecG [Candidatus Harrisonbacteria bacterium]
MYLPIAQVTVSILLIVLILLQERSSGLSGVFGGESEGSFYHTRRGLEKLIFWGTILLSTAFAALALLDLIL